MHHKYAVLDEQVLLTGSFNWTRSVRSVVATDPDRPWLRLVRTRNACAVSDEHAKRLSHRDMSRLSRIDRHSNTMTKTSWLLHSPSSCSSTMVILPGCGPDMLRITLRDVLMSC